MYPQVIAFPLALANGPTINLHLNGASTAAHSIQPGVGTPIAQRPAIPLDSLIPLFSRLDFIKMDTEGSEVDVGITDIATFAPGAVRKTSKRLAEAIAAALAQALIRVQSEMHHG